MAGFGKLCIELPVSSVKIMHQSEFSWNRINIRWFRGTNHSRYHTANLLILILLCYMTKLSSFLHEIN
jgi:hypothetical protein